MRLGNGRLAWLRRPTLNSVIDFNQTAQFCSARQAQGLREKSVRFKLISMVLAV
jgi:hypothetical protein